MAIKIYLKLEARTCDSWDAVPWEQMQGATPLTKGERALFAAHTGYKLPKSLLLVRFDACRIFAKDKDLAVCLYNYQRSFLPPKPKATPTTVGTLKHTLDICPSRE